MINDFNKIWQQLKNEPKEYKLRKLNPLRLLSVLAFISTCYFAWNTPKMFGEFLLYIVGKIIIVWLLLMLIFLILGFLDFIFPKTK